MLSENRMNPGVLVLPGCCCSRKRRDTDSQLLSAIECTSPFDLRGPSGNGAQTQEEEVFCIPAGTNAANADAIHDADAHADADADSPARPD